MDRPAERLSARDLSGFPTAPGPFQLPRAWIDRVVESATIGSSFQQLRLPELKRCAMTFRPRVILIAAAAESKLLPLSSVVRTAALPPG